MLPSDRIKAQALALGFDAVGIADPAAIGAEIGDRLDRFIALGRHGDMGWMAEKADRRRHPRALWPAARSVVMLGQNYGRDPFIADPISIYAQGRDYHDVVKKRLKALARWLQGEYGGDLKVFVDTAPVMEKPLAQAAGLGWQGKHTNLVSRGFGSWLFLGAVFTTLELAPDAPESDHCGACRACLDICPTEAFPAPYQIDARRCISYLTIEHKGQIPAEFRAAIGQHVYGCDDCLSVCPWNKFAQAAREIAFAAGPGARAGLAELARLDEAGFRALFAGSPVKRIGRDRFVRNVLVALGNVGDPADARLARDLLSDASPLVRGMAVWALARLVPAGEWQALRDARRPGETDEGVRAEWDAREE